MKNISFNILNVRKFGAMLLGLSLCLLTGCSTITFVQLEQTENTSPTVNRWHHSTINGMVEISKPLNIQSICNKKAWTTITTEFTLLNALPVILVPSTSLISFYSAWTNKVNCYEIIKTENSTD